SAAPFVNALLRKVTRRKLWFEALRRTASQPIERDRNSQPVEVRVSAPPQPLAHFADWYAHPPWLVERWGWTYGRERTIRILQYDQHVPVAAIRLPSSEDEAELLTSGVVLRNGDILKTAARVETGDITGTPPYQAGRIAIQDEASQ